MHKTCEDQKIFADNAKVVHTVNYSAGRKRTKAMHQQPDLRPEVCNLPYERICN